VKKVKGPFDLEQRQIQRIYRERLEEKEKVNWLFPIVMGCIIFGGLLLAALILT
jgi:hypothetical protein